MVVLRVDVVDQQLLGRENAQEAGGVRRLKGTKPNTGRETIFTLRNLPGRDTISTPAMESISTSSCSSPSRVSSLEGKENDSGGGLGYTE